MKFFIKLTFLLFFFTSIFSQSIPKSKLETARRALLKKDYIQAERLYLELYNNDPQNWLYISGLNSVYLIKKEYDKSILLINDRIKNRPDDIKAFCELGSTYYLMNKVSEAFKLWDLAYEKSGSNQTMISMVSNFPLRFRCFDKALEYLIDGKSKISSSISFLHQIGNIYISTQNFVEATKTYCEIIEVDSKRLSYAENALRRMFSTNNIIPECAKIIEGFYDKTDKVEFLKLLKTFYLLGNDFSRLKDISIQIFEINKNVEELFQISQKLYQEKEFFDSKELNDKVIEFGETMPISVSAKISNLLIEKRQTSEIDDLKKLLSKFENLLKNIKFSQFRPELEFHIADLNFQLNKNIKGLKDVASKYLFNKFSPLALEKISHHFLANKQLDSAEIYLNKLNLSKVSSVKQKQESEYWLIKSCFWQNKFKESYKKINSFLSDTKSKFSNELIELGLILSLGKKDTVSLSKLSEADYLSFAGEEKKSSELYKALSQKENLLIINSYSAIKLSEKLVSIGEFKQAADILAVISQKEKISPFYDKALYLQGRIYHLYIKDLKTASEKYSELINKFPDSIYVDDCRKKLMLINKASEKV